MGGRKNIRPVKSEWWGAGVVICLERGADLHMAQLMPLPLTVSCFSKIGIGFTFLVPAHPGSPGKRPLSVCVCVCVCVCRIRDAERGQTWCSLFNCRSIRRVRHSRVIYHTTQSNDAALRTRCWLQYTQREPTSLPSLACNVQCVKRRAGDRSITGENMEKSQHTDFNEDATDESASVACSNIRL